MRHPRDQPPNRDVVSSTHRGKDKGGTYGNGAASRANLGGEVTEDDTEQTEESGGRVGACGLDTVAALDGTGVALASTSGGGHGDRKGRESDNDSGELGEHCEWKKRVWVGNGK